MIVTKPSSVKHLPTDDTIRLICRYVPSSSGNGEWEVLSPMLVSKSGLTETSISSLLRRCRIRRHHIHRTGYQFRLQYSGIYCFLAAGYIEKSQVLIACRTGFRAGPQDLCSSCGCTSAYGGWTCSNWVVAGGACSAATGRCAPTCSWWGSGNLLILEVIL